MDYERTLLELEGAFSQALVRIVMINDAEAAKTFDHIAGEMTKERCVEIGRAVLNGDRERVFALCLESSMAAIKTEAEIRAATHIEDHMQAI